MDPRDRPSRPAQTQNTDDTGIQPEHSLLATLLSNADTRDKAIAALGDQDTAFRILAWEFGLKQTFSYVENAPRDAGTSCFAVEPTTFIVPSVSEVSISMSRTSSSGPEEIAVSLMCLFNADSPQAEIGKVEHALAGFTPETGSHPPAVSISFEAPRVDVVARLEALFETLHKPCGLHPNMKLTTLLDAFLKLPEPSRRAIELFQRKALDVGEKYLHNGPPEDRRTLEGIISSSIEGLGAIALFEARHTHDLESLADLSGSPVWCLLESILHHHDDPGFRQTVNYMENLMEEFVASKDLRGMCGLATVLTLQRQDAIVKDSSEIFKDNSYDLPLDNLPSEYERLVAESLGALPSLARTPEDHRLIAKIINALRAEGELFDRNHEAIEQETADERETFQMPVWAQNRFFLCDAVEFAPKPVHVEEVLHEILPLLSQHGDDRGARLIKYGIMNPDLQESILEVIDEEGLFSSPALLMEKVHLRVKQLLPPEVTATMTQTVNYLADEMAILLDVM
jgi:hypothetical protein